MTGPHMPPPLTDWSAAKCHNDPDTHPEDFFPVQFYRDGLPLAHTLELRAYCKECPIQADCLEDAIEKRDDYGFRGGLTPEERAELRKRRGAARKNLPIQHGTKKGYVAHTRRQNDPPCDACRAAYNAYKRGQYRDAKESA